MHTHQKLSALVLAFGLVAGAAAAPVTTYATRVDYLAATTGNTLVDFEAQNLNGPSGYTYHGNSLTVGNVSFVQPDARMFVFGKDYYLTGGATGNYLNQNCCAPGGLVINFTNDVFAVAMDYGQQNDWNSSDLSITFTLSTGEVITRTPAGVMYNNSRTMDFLGFTSDVAINSITIANPAQGFAMDNLLFTESRTSVPEPSGLFLSALALAALAVTRRKAGRSTA